jgi:hypothetical protein
MNELVSSTPVLRSPAEAIPQDSAVCLVRKQLSIQGFPNSKISEAADD